VYIKPRIKKDTALHVALLSQVILTATGTGTDN